MAHKYSIETLFHFTCSSCKNWWSYASEEHHAPSHMFCPHCGQNDSTDDADPLHTTHNMVKLTPQHAACGD